MGHLTIPATAGGVQRIIGIGINGADPASFPDQVNGVVSATTDARLAITGIYELAAGDYIEIMAYQDSGGAVSVSANSYGSIMYLGEQV
jgi:hypothetical protein